MKRWVWVFAILSCFVAPIAHGRQGESPSEMPTSVFVKTTLPVYVRGRRLDAIDGGHIVTISKQNGITVDGFEYMENRPDPQPVTPRIEDGFFHYVAATASSLGQSVAGRGGSPEKVRDVMRDFFSTYRDSLTVSESHMGFTLSYKGDEVLVPIPHARSAQERPSYYDRVLTRYFKRVVKALQGDYLLICGRGYFQVVAAEDAASVIAAIELLPSQVNPTTLPDGDLYYPGQKLMDGKYNLGPSAVRELVEQAGR